MCRDGFVRCRGVSGDGMRNVGIGLGGLGGEGHIGWEGMDTRG